MASDIHLLELASGIKESLVRAGFLTVESILASSIANLSNKVGVDPYIAQIILQAARKFGTTAPVANL
jgi:small basic protein